MSIVVMFRIEFSNSAFLENKKVNKFYLNLAIYF